MKIKTLNENMTEKDNREFWDIVDIVGNAVNTCDGDLDDIRGEITHPYSDEDKFKVVFLSTTGKKGSRSFNYRVRKAVTEALKNTRFDDNIDVLSYQLDDNEIRHYVPRGLLRDFQKYSEMFEVEVTAYDDKSTPSSFKDVLGEDMTIAYDETTIKRMISTLRKNIEDYKQLIEDEPEDKDYWEEQIKKCEEEIADLESYSPIQEGSSYTTYEDGITTQNKGDRFTITSWESGKTLYSGNSFEDAVKCYRNADSCGEGCTFNDAAGWYQQTDVNRATLGTDDNKKLKESAPRFYVTIYALDSVSGPEEGGYTNYGWEPFKSKFFRGEDEARDFIDSWTKGMEIISKEDKRLHVKDDYDDEYIVALEHGGNRGRTEESPRTWAQAEFDAPNPRKYFDKSGRRLYNNPYADAKRAKELKALEKSFADRIESATTKEDIVMILADSNYMRVHDKLGDKLKKKWDEIAGNSLNEDSQFKLSGRLLPIEILDDNTPQRQRAVLTQEVADKLERFLRINRLWVDEFYFNSMKKTIEFDVNWGDWKHEHMRAKWLIEDFFGDKDEFVRINSYTTEEDGSDTYSAHYTLK